MSRVSRHLELLRVSYALVACICTDDVMRVCRRVQCGGGWEDLQGNNYIAMWQRDLVFDKMLYRKHWKRGESSKRLSHCLLAVERKSTRAVRQAGVREYSVRTAVTQSAGPGDSRCIW